MECFHEEQCLPSPVTDPNAARTNSQVGESSKETPLEEHVLGASKKFNIEGTISQLLASLSDSYGNRIVA